MHSPEKWSKKKSNREDITVVLLQTVSRIDCNHIPRDNIPALVQPHKRENVDNCINDHGKIILDICKSSDLRILNGRTKGDSLGKFTYHSSGGESTVDYITVSSDIFPSVEGFIVKQPTFTTCVLDENWQAKTKWGKW